MSIAIESAMFRFVSLRQPNKREEPRSGVVRIEYPTEIPLSPFGGPVGGRDLAADGAETIAWPPPLPPTLYQRLLNIRNANGPRAEYESVVSEFRASSRWIPTSGALAPWTLLYEKIRRMPGAASDPALQPMIQEALRIESLPDYVTGDLSLATRMKLFDNLFSTVITPDDPPLREALLSALKVEQMIIGIAARAAQNAVASTSLPPIAMEFNVLLPREIFPIPAEADDGLVIVPVSGPEVKSTATDAGTARGMQAALDDLEAADAAERRGQTATLAPATQELLGTLRGDGFSAPITEARAALAQSLTAIASSAAQVDAASKTLTVARMYLNAGELCRPHLPDTCLPYEGGPLPEAPGRVHSLGIADLLVVRQMLQGYVPGEVSHITNVMASETRSTTHRHLQRVEETVSIDRETTTESERDLQSTERFSLSNEAKQVIADDAKFNAGVNATASYGPVQLSANASYATTSSQQTATTVASSYAREVTQRATEKVTERVREQRSRTTIEEIEETNLHSFTNTSDSHIVGIYQWVDVVYLARLFNLGRRLMLEFIVPEPAAFHVYASAALQSAGGGVDNPAPPTDPGPLGVLNSAADLTATNYAAWAARYGAVEVEPPPQEWVTVAAAYASSNVLTQYDVVGEKSLKVPDGYAADTARVRLAHSTGVDGTTYVRAFIGGSECLTTTGSQFFSLAMAGETGTIPINLQSAKTYLLANVEILCRLTPEARDAWKLKTYNAIIAAYAKRKAAHDQAVGAGEGPRVFPPSRNREIERQELKRGCLQILTGQRFDAFSAMRVHQALDYPEFLDGRAAIEGKYMQFFEQACDWSNMTYTFYPYFWTRKPNWIRMRGYESDDPIFTSFLQAGAARVVVPAHPAYTKAVLHFLSSGEIWNGDDVPVVGDPLYVSIVEELMEGSGFGESADPLAEWNVRLPTTLTMLKTVDPGVLPDWS